MGDHVSLRVDEVRQHVLAAARLGDALSEAHRFERFGHQSDELTVGVGQRSAKRENWPVDQRGDAHLERWLVRALDGHVQRDPVDRRQDLIVAASEWLAVDVEDRK